MDPQKPDIKLLMRQIDQAFTNWKLDPSSPEKRQIYNDRKQSMDDALAKLKEDFKGHH
jgi:hypothetical protein